MPTLKERINPQRSRHQYLKALQNGKLNKQQLREMEMALLTPDPHPELSKELYKAVDWGELVNIKENEGVSEWR